MSKQTNEPASPINRLNEVQFPGMTLLDWFAGQALAGGIEGNGNAGDYALRAHVAYKQARAMLAERQKEGKQS